MQIDKSIGYWYDGGTTYLDDVVYQIYINKGIKFGYYKVIEDNDIFDPQFSFITGLSLETSNGYPLDVSNDYYTRRYNEAKLIIRREKINKLLNNVHNKRI